MFNSQVELEEYMMSYGKDRAHRIISNNEEKGRAELNPYAKGFFKSYVKDFADIIEKDCNTKNPGTAKAHVSLIKDTIEYSTIAYLSIRTVLSILMQKTEENNARKISYEVGKVMQAEMVAMQQEVFNKDHYIKTMEELQRRCSTDVDHRRKLIQDGLIKVGIDPINWGIGNREQVGTYLVEKMVELGLLNLYKTKKKSGNKFKSITTVGLTDEALNLISDLTDFFEGMSILYLPTIEKPKDWVDVGNGGFHTPRLQAIFNTAILGGNKRNSKTETLLESINTLQSTAWKINEKVLDVFKQCQLGRDMSEVVGNDIFNKPDKPSWLVEGLSKEDMTEEQKVQFKVWKKSLTEWHTESKLRIQKRSRMLMSTMVAEKFKNERELFFVYQADFRKRVYPRTMGVNPQGSDLQKALLHFSEQKPITTQEAKEWFLIHGANKFGYDKATLEDRIKWVEQHHDVILRIAEDPMSFDKWKEADNPFQFLAWCFEYSDFTKYGKFFKSALPISMDGSCNGLQNLSAALRDLIGGKATNLLPGLKPSDIYQEVANVLLEKLKVMPDDEKGYRKRWVQHGIKRSLVKRSVMTLPYGSTMFSARDFILKDYMLDVLPEEFEKAEYKYAALFLAKVLWKSIGEVVIKAREAMTWLQECSSIIMKTEKSIDWETPGGFVVSQGYKRSEEIGKIRVSLFNSDILLYAIGKEPDKRRHRNGIAPNFIHSMDASHMQAVTIRCKNEGIKSLAMIHDDFGTHAEDAAKMNRIIREEFVKMYQEDYFMKFYERYKHLGISPPPEKGELDLNATLDSKYFFC